MWVRIALTLILVAGAITVWALASGELTVRFDRDETLSVVPQFWINAGLVALQSLLIAVLVGVAALLSRWRDRLFPPRPDRDADR